MRNKCPFCLYHNFVEIRDFIDHIHRDHWQNVTIYQLIEALCVAIWKDHEEV